MFFSPGFTDKIDGFDGFDDDVDLLTLEVSRGPMILAQFFWKLIGISAFLTKFDLHWLCLGKVRDPHRHGLYAVAGLLLVVGGVQEVMRQIEFGEKLYLLLHVAVAISNYPR
jgi:hypothetical protein